MKEIPLNHGKVAVVDDEDFEIVCGHLWRAMRGVSGVWYAVCRDCKPTHKMHRMLITVPAGMVPDHRDGNGLNNTRSNLRAATPTQNQANAKLRKDNKSGFKGVTPTGKHGKWRAQIKVGDGFVWLGSHTTPELAAAAYDAAAKKYYGEFARVNFPEGVAA